MRIRQKRKQQHSLTHLEWPKLWSFGCSECNRVKSCHSKAIVKSFLKLRNKINFPEISLNMLYTCRSLLFFSVRLWDIDQQKNVVIYKGHNYPVWDVDTRFMSISNLVYLQKKEKQTLL